MELGDEVEQLVVELFQHGEELRRSHDDGKPRENLWSDRRRELLRLLMDELDRRDMKRFGVPYEEHAMQHQQMREWAPLLIQREKVLQAKERFWIELTRDILRDGVKYGVRFAFTFIFIAIILGATGAWRMIVAPFVK